jgi:hypothetical protein
LQKEWGCQKKQWKSLLRGENQPKLSKARLTVLHSGYTGKKASQTWFALLPDCSYPTGATTVTIACLRIVEGRLEMMSTESSESVASILQLQLPPAKDKDGKLLWLNRTQQTMRTASSTLLCVTRFSSSATLNETKK